DAPRDGVLHVWATWCAPCRDELPGLLAAAEAEGVALVALSVDESADAVAVFFGGRVPPQVVRDPRGVPGVRELPATLRVRGGELVERVQGARDWSSPEARAWLRRP
ncbi:MAG: TlpA family protein disulfide reductase, partial [Myxococcota bacterium]